MLLNNNKFYAEVMQVADSVHVAEKNQEYVVYTYSTEIM